MKQIIYVGSLAACLVLAQGVLCESHAGTLPQILVEPVSRTVQAGDSAVFRVYQTGGTVRWFVKSAEVVTGAQGDSLVLRNVQLSDDKSKVQCLVSNSDGVRTCAAVLLNVLRPTREMLTFTGTLSELSGTLVASSTFSSLDMRLDVYKSMEGGSAVYSEVFVGAEGRGVAVNDGRFVLRAGTGRILKGSIADFTQDASPLFAQFSVGTDDSREILNPRVPLTAMPYALSAGSDMLKGTGSPIVLGLDAPVGTRYTDVSTGKVWYRGVRTWVSAP